ncbi:hypothetical protein [Flavivirga spongiicola]|uniref:Uncharacterized protein n=1 Tax=Flavivirga spongiicola TaxID=421621 RepID=A0ABU7XRF3_9FLAO|nr:hypothetical protein [Flavivirga sp. MEBiC05379]MDO5978121.1 hypothetical protein [Flavivirga sp. MEBiC05379]
MVIKFNTKELLFIKKYAYGINSEAIKDKICLGCDDMFMALKQEFKMKLNVDCDIQMIQRSYNNNLFDIDNYFLMNQQHIAFGTAYNVYVSTKDNPVYCYNMTLKELYVKVLRAHIGIIKNYKKTLKFCS